tara:strand:- start:640 stop:2526 length:1887 start_codon:yes stop_codon:yes gene_type:complete
MKWIGQHIWDFISRFRNDVYLENLSTTSEDEILVVDADGKISKKNESTLVIDVSDFMTNGVDNRIVTATGADSLNAEANFTFDGTNLDLTSTSTTAAVFDIVSNTLTTGSFATFTQSDTSTSSATSDGLLEISYTKSGVTGSGNTRSVTGSKIQMVDSATNHGSSTVDIIGQTIQTALSSNSGTTSTRGLSVITTGADTNIGIQVASDDIGLKIASVADADDYYSVSVSGNGATTVKTVDDSSHAADLTFDVDGLTHFTGDGVHIEPGSSAGVSALEITDTDIDEFSIEVSSTNTAKDILSISTATLTTGKPISVAQVDMGTTNLTVPGNFLYYAKAGVTASGQTKTATGFTSHVYDAATNHASSTNNLLAGKFKANFDSAQGTNKTHGIEVEATGGDTNIGITTTVTDGGTDIKCMSSADSADYFTVRTTTSGLTYLSTVDSDATVAHIYLDADGDITLDAASGNINLKDDGGNYTPGSDYEAATKKYVDDNAGSDGWHGSTTRVKILHSDFTGDDGGRPYMIDDTGVGSENLYGKTHSTMKAYATVNIPTGYKATHVMIYGTNTPAVEVWEHQIDSKTGVSKGTGNVDTEINITDVTSSTTNYLFIQVNQASADEIHGGYVTIAAV